MDHVKDSGGGLLDVEPGKGKTVMGLNKLYRPYPLNYDASWKYLWISPKLDLKLGHFIGRQYLEAHQPAVL